MVTLQDILEELKALPPEGLEKVADYIHGLHFTGSRDRKTLLRSTAGSLSDKEADELAQTIEEGCEQISFVSGLSVLKW